jgi:protein disulfide-isomerase A1
MGFPFGYIFADTFEGRSQLRKEIEPLARKYRQNLQFAIADPVDLEDIVDNLHLNITRFPAFAILEPNANLRYPMDEASTRVFIEAVETFVRDFLNGDLQPTIKSELLPPPDSKEAFVKIVGLNYNDIVMDSSRDVLVMYSITPCGPCEALESTLESLAELYASSPQLKDQVRIGKVMYDANDTPEQGIRGFPTIKLFPAASKRLPEMFLADRTLDDLADFIRDKGTFHADFRSLGEQWTESLEPLPMQNTCESEDGACAAT